MFSFAKTPRIITKFFKSYTWFFSAKKKEIYLTFDDGPTPEVTNFVLATLKEYKAKATFFCIGRNVASHPEIYQQILADGHSVGNHTYNHLNGWKTNSKKYLDNINKASKLINSKLFRPPYGKIKPIQAKKLTSLGYKIIMWNILSGDFDHKVSSGKSLQNVLKNVEKGSIIVFHDSVKASKTLYDILPKVLEKLSADGYVFKAI